MLTYLIFFIPPMLLAMWAQWRVKSAYAEGIKTPASSGLTGAETAHMILQAHNINDVKIEPVSGYLSDHYDPRTKTLRLSPDNYGGHSVAALGIAAHEAGHAVQHAVKYGPLMIRNGIVPLTAVAPFGIFLMIGGMVMGGAAGMAKGGIWFWLMVAGIAVFGIIALFQLINLPVEFDASNRAKKLLVSANLIQPGAETAMMNRVLNAAAWTYVAATLGAVLTFLYYLLQSGLLGGRRN